MSIETVGPRPPTLDPSAVTGVVFDLDGTLVDSYQAIADSLNHAREQFDLPPMPLEEVRTQVGRGLETLIADFVGPDRIEAGVTLFRRHYASSFARSTSVLPGVGTALHRLSAFGIRMAVASNKPARFGEAILRHLGLGRFFVCVEGPDLAGTTKPEPTMIRRCLSRMNVRASNAVYVGDMELDVESAARAGLPVVLVATGSRSEEELQRTGQPVCRTLEALPDLLLP